MNKRFDPYHTWLGIPPKHQPPNHYRLLGLEEFEDNLDVIDHAADRQTAHVRMFQTGRHAIECQELLGAIASARICLLNPEKKAAYDQTLSATLNDPDPPPIETARTGSGEEPPVVAPILLKPAKRRSLNGLPCGLILLAIVIVVGVLVIALLPENLPTTKVEKGTDVLPSKFVGIADSDMEAESRSEEPEISEDKKKLENQQADVPPLEALLDRIQVAVEKKNLVRTRTLGGSRGSAFEDIPKQGALLVGFNITTSRFFAGHLTIKSLEPIFQTRSELMQTESHGRPHGKATTVKAIKGYAIGGLIVRSGHRVDRVCAVFMRISNSGLDPEDSYKSPWYGGQGGGGETELGGDGDPVVGIHGHRGTDLDAIGLVQALTTN